MAESRRDATRAQREADTTNKHVIEEAEKATRRGAKETETATERGIKETERAIERGVEEAETAAERGVEALKWQTERAEETGREAARQVSEISAPAFRGAARTGLALADATGEVAEVWAHYAEDVVRNTSQASQALSRSCNIFDVMQVQIALVHNNMRSFFDQSAKLADAASRMVTRPFEVLREESAKQAPR